MTKIPFGEIVTISGLKGRFMVTPVTYHGACSGGTASVCSHASHFYDYMATPVVDGTARPERAFPMVWEPSRVTVVTPTPAFSGGQHD